MRSLALAGLVLGAAACGADDDTAGGATTPETAEPAATEPAAPETYPATGEVVEVLALDNNFIPQDVTVAAGTEVRWVNNGRNDHNVLPENDPETTTWGVQLEEFHPGDSYSHVFTTPGTYVYYCSIHGTSTAGMFGSVVVTEP